ERQQMVRARLKPPAARVDVAGLLGEMKVTAVGADEAPLGDDKVAAAATGGDAELNMILVEPIVGVERSDAVIGFGDGEQRSGAAGDVAVIAVRLIELDMAHAGGV